MVLRRRARCRSSHSLRMIGSRRSASLSSRSPCSTCSADGHSRLPTPALVGPMSLPRDPPPSGGNGEAGDRRCCILSDKVLVLRASHPNVLIVLFGKEQRELVSP